VRVTDLRGVDLARFRFDYGLTFAVLLMHPDGTVYHRYGARDERAADVWLGEESWASVLRETLAEHARYAAAPDPPPQVEPLRLEDVPAYAKRDKNKCIHCHEVRPPLYEEALAAGTWEASDAWFQPPPGRVGIDLANHEQNRVVAVEPGSPAAGAGLVPGDRLLSLDGARILTASDVSWTLGEVPPEGRDVPFEAERDGATVSGTLALAAGWKRPTPREYSWRPFRWALKPGPGFGAKSLEPGEKRALGLEPDAFAIEVQAFLFGGNNGPYARAAQQVGLRKGDIVVAADGRSDFSGYHELLAWWGLEHGKGDEVVLEVLRDGARERLVVPIAE
jgi:hypothetical protein